MQVAYGLGMVLIVFFVVMGFIEGGFYPWVRAGGALVATLLIRRQLVVLVEKDTIKKVDRALEAQQKQQQPIP